MQAREAVPAHAAPISDHMQDAMAVPERSIVALGMSTRKDGPVIPPAALGAPTACGIELQLELHSASPLCTGAGRCAPS